MRMPGGDKDGGSHESPVTGVEVGHTVIGITNEETGESTTIESLGSASDPANGGDGGSIGNSGDRCASLAASGTAGAKSKS